MLISELHLHSIVLYCIVLYRGTIICCLDHISRYSIDKFFNLDTSTNFICTNVAATIYCLPYDLAYLFYNRWGNIP